MNAPASSGKRLDLQPAAAGSDFELDAIDRQLIACTQAGLPLLLAPYKGVADQIGVSAEEVMARFQRMLDSGVVRRIAAVPNHYRLGFKANGMSVWDISDEHITEAGREVAALEFVSHCYRRPRRLPLWRYNLFAMVHGREPAEVEQKVDSIEALLGGRVRAHEVLYSTRILKKTGLRLSRGNPKESGS